MIKILDNNYIKNNNNVLNVTDANGTIIDASISDFTDFNTDFNGTFTASDSEIGEIKSINTLIKDSDDSILNISDSELISEVKSEDVIAVDVKIEATHSGGNLNNAIYSSSSLEKDYKTWLYPYKKPFIKNHNMDSEAIGRVEDSYFAQSEIDTERDCINLILRVSDKDSMVKFADKRYATVSVAGQPKSIQCNICGKDIVKDGQVKFCGHWKGNVYGGKKSQWIMTDIGYRECSIVNSPADVYAQVKEIKLIRKGDKKMDGVTPKDNAATIVTTTTDANDNAAVLENLLEGDTTVVTEDNTTTENATTDNTVVADNTVVDKDEEIKQLKDKVAECEKNISELEAEKVTLTDSVKKIQDELEETKAIKDSNLETAKKMAVMNKDLMIKNLILLKPELSDSDELELNSKTVKELNEAINDAKTARDGITVVKQVESPVAAINDNHTVKDTVTSTTTSTTTGTKNYLDIF